MKAKEIFAKELSTEIESQWRLAFSRGCTAPTKLSIEACSIDDVDDVMDGCWPREIAY